LSIEARTSIEKFNTVKVSSCRDKYGRLSKHISLVYKHTIEMDSSQTHHGVFSKQHGIDKKLVMVLVVMITYILLGVVVLIG
jgi:hypothetical protein